MPRHEPPAQEIPGDLLAAYTAVGQQQVFRFWSELDADERAAFSRELREVDLDSIASWKRNLASPDSPASVNRQPAPVLRLDEDPAFASREAAEAEGRRLVAAGKVGVFLVAGGQGSRLGYDGPKGCLPVGPLSEKTLFQLHAEKIAFLIERGGRLPWYIMTSPSNDAATREFFAAHSFFGLRKEDIFFLPQRMLPALDAAGKLILESKGRLFQSPNGHGGAYAAFRDGGSIEDAERRGIEHLFYFQVDNPLVRLADPLFMGLHALAGSEMSLKILRKTGPEEKIGVIAVEDGRTKVVEYSDLSKAEAERRDARGELAYWAGSIAIHAFRFEFFRRACEGRVPLPLHVAKKKVASIDAAGKPAEIEATKLETFVFDALPHAARSLSVEVRREREFAPIKNKTGVDSLESARAMLVEEHRRWLKEAGVDARGRVEVSPLAASSAASMRERLARDARSPGPVADDVRVELDRDGTARIHPRRSSAR